jgi:hypothetical protein
MVEWLQKWYSDRCNGDWEHTYGIEIGNIDNPGWSLTVDLVDTHLEMTEIPYTLWEVDEENWLGYSIMSKEFNGACDPTRLNRLIEVFKEIFECKDLNRIKNHVEACLNK